MTEVSLLEKTSSIRGTVSKTACLNTGILAAGILLIILAHFIIHPLLIPAEAALNLEYGKLIISGQSPYLDFFDYQSPVPMYLCLIPDFISIYLKVHPITAFNLCVWLLVTLSTAISAHILFRTSSREISVAPYLLVGYLLLNLIFIDQFGETQQVFFAFILPYVLSRVLNLTSSGGAIDIRVLGLTGSMAAVGFLLDPLYLLLMILFEAFICAERGRFDSLSKPEFTVCFSILILCGFVLIIGNEPMGVALSHFGLPMMLLDYDTWNNDLVYLGMTPDRRDLLYLSILACVAALAFYRFSKLILPMVIISFLGFGLYIVQYNMYTAQALPMVFGAGLAFSLVVGILVNWFVAHFKLRSKLPGTLVFGALSLASVFAWLSVEVAGVSHGNRYSLSEQGYIGSSPRADLSIFADYIEANSKPGDQVLIINDQARPAYPTLLQLGRRPGSGFLTTRLLKVARKLRYSKPLEVWQPYVVAEDQLYDRLKNDIRTKRPVLILVNQDSMGPALEEKLVSKELLDNYEPVGFLDWRDDNADHPSFEYIGYRTAFHAFKLKRGE